MRFPYGYLQSIPTTIAARLVGTGFQPEHVKTPAVLPSPKSKALHCVNQMTIALAIASDKRLFEGHNEM